MFYLFLIIQIYILPRVQGQGAMGQDALELRILLRRKFKIQLMMTAWLRQARICCRAAAATSSAQAGSQLTLWRSGGWN